MNPAVNITKTEQAELLLAGENRLLGMVARGHPLPSILTALCQLFEELCSDSLTSVLLLDSRTRQLWHGAAPSLPPEYTQAINGGAIGPSAGSCGTAAYRGEPVIVSDIAVDPLWLDYRSVALASGLRACWSMPIFSTDRKVLGTFAIYSRQPGSPTQQQHDIIAQLAHLASIAIERARAEEEQVEARMKLENALAEIKLLKDQLYKENIALREEIDRSSMFEEIVGNSPPLQEVLARVAKVAQTESSVLITGETGTGKELIARAIHKRSARSGKAFVSVNCAAIPPSLIVSELFGHEKGAFTGALQRRAGRFELAHGGTLFLDEVGDLPAESQVALLRVLQENEFERVGGTQPIRADVRLIAATNRDLQAAIVAGKFRSDLYYRLSVFPIEMPSLRARRDDIALLTGYFIHRYASRMGKKISRISKKTLALFQAYDWPGNIRELQNIVERSLIVCETTTFSVDESWLAREPVRAAAAPQPLSIKLAIDEKAIIERVLAETWGRVSGPAGAAVRLGVPASTLESKIRVLKINKHLFKTR